jgi:hypothetical protein
MLAMNHSCPCWYAITAGAEAALTGNLSPQLNTLGSAGCFVDNHHQLSWRQTAPVQAATALPGESASLPAPDRSSIAAIFSNIVMVSQ